MRLCTNERQWNIRTLEVVDPIFVEWIETFTFLSLLFLSHSKNLAPHVTQE